VCYDDVLCRFCLKTMVPHFMACHFSEVSKFVEVVVLVMFQDHVVL
jgi:hypothetical protein